MTRPTDIQPTGAALYFLPVQTRVPLKFGGETLTSVTCARACLGVGDASGKSAVGWGETPLSVQWVWPSAGPYEPRHQALRDFCVQLARAWARFHARGHALEVGHCFIEEALPSLLSEFNQKRQAAMLPEPMPFLAALVCASAFDIALHDAFGNLHGLPTYQTYNAKYLSHDLAPFLDPAPD